MSKKNTFWDNGKILRIISKPGARVHFVGVGGAGMSSLFCLTRHFGISASGSDAKSGEFVELAMHMGEKVYVGESADVVTGADIVVYSLAVADDNSEIVAAEKCGIPTVSRADYFSALTRLYSNTVAISGSHGKSTATAMLYSIFDADSREPTVVCGAEFETAEQKICRLGIGTLDYLIYESCEYKDSFLAFRPDVALFLNLELDHTDYFKDIEHIASSFAKAIKNADLAVINGDDKRLASIALQHDIKCIGYGEGNECDYRYCVNSMIGAQPQFSVWNKGKKLGEIHLLCIGRFNVANATAAIACAMEMGIPFSSCKKGIESFRGVSRRLEMIGEWQGNSVYYDYAHHPTEIRAGILALKDMGIEEITVIFSAHTYSRTEAMLSDFITSLSLADRLILTEIDAVREKSFWLSSSDFAKACGGVLVKNQQELSGALCGVGGAILLMGAGDNEWVKKFLIKT